MEGEIKATKTTETTMERIPDSLSETRHVYPECWEITYERGATKGIDGFKVKSTSYLSREHAIAEAKAMMEEAIQNTEPKPAVPANTVTDEGVALVEAVVAQSPEPEAKPKKRKGKSDPVPQPGEAAPDMSNASIDGDRPALEELW